MKNLGLTLEEIQQLHEKGQLSEAKAAYLAFLEDHPREIAALHHLGILYTQEGDLAAAQRYLEQAVQYDPQNPTIYLHLANILKAQGSLEQARDLLIKAIEMYPNFTAALNNLGNVYFAQSEWQQAIHCYQAALEKQPDYIDVYYNLGLALSKLGRIDEAISAYIALLSLATEHAAAQFQLACLFMRKNQYKKALEQFLQVEAKHSHHFETETNLAACYLHLGLLSEAKQHYQKALGIDAKDSYIFFNLGVINMQQGYIERAIENYQRAIKLNPDFFDAHNNLAIAWMVTKNSYAALLHFREAQRIGPDNIAIKHTIDILAQQKEFTGSPPEYIQTLFDSYADHYEPHLLQSLHYEVPQLLYQAITKIREIPDKKWDILDLGCGTGLCGIIFKSAAQRLVGIDISEKMLAIAKQKKIYDELIQSDILTFLSQDKTSFDLIVAGDTLVYFGELSIVLSAIHDHLKPKGLLVFNAEISDKENYYMTPSGRFAHNKNYIDKLAQQNGFHITSYQVVVLRTQENIPVYGHLYVLEA